MNFIAFSYFLTITYDFIFIFYITCFFFIYFGCCKFNISIFLEKKNPTLKHGFKTCQCLKHGMSPMSCFICWDNPTIPPNASINMKAFTTKWSNNIKIGEQIPMIVQYKVSIE